MLVRAGFEPTTSLSADRSSPSIRDLMIRQRRCQWKRSWKIDFASFTNFSPLYQVTQSLERRGVRLELKRGDRVRFQIEKVKFIALRFPLSSQLKISCYVVVVQGRQRNVQKAWCTCSVVVFLIKLTAFLTFPLPKTGRQMSPHGLDYVCDTS